MSEHLRIEDSDGVRVVTIDRPEAKNALHAPLRRELRAAFVAADVDETVRVVVLTGVDPVFSAGVDFKLIERAPTRPPDRPTTRRPLCAPCARP
jgi:enoyl-CoA hydratase